MPTSTSRDPAKLTAYIKDVARQAGFDVCRVTSAETETRLGEDLAAYVAAGHHGTMAWMEETRERRASPVCWQSIVQGCQR